jgi:hypothetical protein
MNNTYKTSTTTKLTLIGSATILVALVLTSQPSQADENQQSSQRRGPPPEAFTACEGKNSGEAAKFQNKRGKTLTGTCEIVGGKFAGELVLRPNNRSDDQKNGKRRGPPQEAFTACEGKTVGASSQFESRRGETLKGTCEEAKQNSNLLVLRPERFNS